MASFGQDLKTVRESRGVSLEDIAQQTKVSVRHLQALEADRYDSLPGGVFNKGIVRNYLQCMALDETEWLARFAGIPGSSGAIMQEDSDWPRHAAALTGGKPAPPGEEDIRFRWLGVLLLFLALAIAAWLVYRFAMGHWRHPAG